VVKSEMRLKSVPHESGNHIHLWPESLGEAAQLVEDFWDDLAATPEVVPVHDWQREELARRKANLHKTSQTPRPGASHTSAQSAPISCRGSA